MSSALSNLSPHKLFSPTPYLTLSYTHSLRVLCILDTFTLTLTHAHAVLLSTSHKSTSSLAQWFIHSLSLTCSHTRTRTLMLIQTHTPLLMHAHTRTHSRTHSFVKQTHSIWVSVCCANRLRVTLSLVWIVFDAHRLQITPKRVRQISLAAGGGVAKPYVKIHTPLT